MDSVVERADVQRWVDAYEAAWRAQDRSAVHRLFAEDVTYLRSPYDEGLRGHDAVGGFWADETDFTMTSDVVAVDGDRAVVRVEVRYGGERPQEYRDLWLLRFARDGRVEHFEEWAYWPGLHFSTTPGPSDHAS